MANKVLITKATLEDIADAIREKNKSTDTYTPSEMVTAIENIPSGTITLKRGVLRPDAELVVLLVLVMLGLVPNIHGRQLLKVVQV